MVWAEQLAQLFEFILPFAVAMVESLREATPPDVTREYTLLFRRGCTLTLLDALQSLDRLKIIAEFCLRAAGADTVSAFDTVVAGNYSSVLTSRIARISCSAMPSEVESASVNTFVSNVC